MAGSKVLLSYINSYLDDTQQDRLAEVEQYNPQQYDMREMQKYRLLDRSPERLVIDDTPRRGVQAMTRPLEIREFGNKSKLSPFLNEVCLQDREKDPRGTETHPQMSKIPLYTLQKGQWIKNNLYVDHGLQQVTEQIQHLKLVENRAETDKRMKDYLKIFSNEKVGAANTRQFNPADIKSGNILAQMQQDQEDSKAHPLKIGAPNKPVKRVDYTKVVSSNDDVYMQTRTQPDHQPEVGDRSQLLYSNPAFDPAQRAAQRGELFTNNKQESLEVLTQLDQRSHINRPTALNNTTFAETLIDEGLLDHQRQDHTLQRHANRTAADPIRPGQDQFDSRKQQEERNHIVKRYKELQIAKRNPNASQYEADHSREKFSNAVTQVRAGRRDRNLQKNGAVSKAVSDMSFIERIKQVVGIKPGKRPSNNNPDARKLGSNDQTMRSTEHLQNTVKPRNAKSHNGIIVNPLAHKDLQTQVDSVNLQYNALSQDAKSAVYRLSAVFVPPQVTPQIKLQIAEEIIELVARNRVPRAQLQTVYNPHASEQDIEQLAIVVTQNIVPRLKQKLNEKDFKSAVQQIQQDHVKAFQQLQGNSHSSSAFAFLGKEALQGKKHNQRNPAIDTDRHQHTQTVTSSNFHNPSDVGFTQRVLAGGGQIAYKEQFAGYSDQSAVQVNQMRSGGDKKRQRNCVQYNSITENNGSERIVGQ